MLNIPLIFRRQCRIICAIAVVCSLLLTGCMHTYNKPDDTKSTDASSSTQTSVNTQDTESIPSSEDSGEASLTSLRQVMVETPQLFAVAYFGNAVQETSDPFTVMQETAPELCNNLPFLLNISEENVIGTSGELYCIVPLDENATVAVNQGGWNDENDAYEYQDVIFRSESGNPLLIMCNNTDYKPDTQVTITDSDGTVVVWCPNLDSSNHIIPLCNDDEESLFHDFSPYDEFTASN